MIVTICVIALANYFIFGSFYGDGFQDRFKEATEGLRQRMIEANMEMQRKMQERLAEGHEPDELVEFGEIWRKRLQVIKTLDAEREKMDGHIKFVNYVLVFGLMHAAIDFVHPLPIMIVAGFQVYPHTLGWAFTFFAAILLILYQMSYRRLDLSLRDVESEIGTRVVRIVVEPD
ncbi:hypothetical protein JXL21_11860 [Candidatus Bathyarchaeota archaeon]|nr:hypothetical protein [Candidatus Bathyarchaeota archaeon]